RVRARANFGQPHWEQISRGGRFASSRWRGVGCVRHHMNSRFRKATSTSGSASLRVRPSCTSSAAIGADWPLTDQVSGNCPAVGPSLLIRFARLPDRDSRDTVWDDIPRCEMLKSFQVLTELATVAPEEITSALFRGVFKIDPFDFSTGKSGEDSVT